MAELERVAVVEQPLPGGRVDAGELGVGQRVRDDELAVAEQVLVEHVDHRVEEAGDQGPSGTEHARHLLPYGGDIGDVHVGHGVHDQVERVVLEARQVGHVRVDQREVESVTARDLLVPGELGLGEVQHGDLRASGGEDRSLLAAPARQAQGPAALQ